jgi:hypothetical protein
LNVPGRLRLGDINADGFPEILVTLVHQNTKDQSTYQSTQILLNSECTVSNCDQAAVKKSRRYFDYEAGEYDSLTSVVGNKT